MKKVNKKIIASILIILVLFSLITPTVRASIFDDDENETQSEIEETIDDDEGGLFEKIIA